MLLIHVRMEHSYLVIYPGPKFLVMILIRTAPGWGFVLGSQCDIRNERLSKDGSQMIPPKISYI